MLINQHTHRAVSTSRLPRNAAGSHMWDHALKCTAGPMEVAWNLPSAYAPLVPGGGIPCISNSNCFGPVECRPVLAELAVGTKTVHKARYVRAIDDYRLGKMDL